MLPVRTVPRTLERTVQLVLVHGLLLHYLFTQVQVQVGHYDGWILDTYLAREKFFVSFTDKLCSSRETRFVPKTCEQNSVAFAAPQYDSSLSNVRVFLTTCLLDYVGGFHVTHKTKSGFPSFCS